ncbi:MAG TPA: penicillin-binding protein 2 [Burkholderiaceae bacterium]|nr:penicillin-binding protein 2 [Burkholderiaceae bacterium]
MKPPLDARATPGLLRAALREAGTWSEEAPRRLFSRSRGAAPRERRRGTGRGHDALAVRLPSWRSKLLLFGLFIAFLALAVRSFFLQGGISTGFLKHEAAERFERTIAIPATRGRITDRNGALLATSVPARLVWAMPEYVDAPPDAMRRLATLLQMAPTELDRRLASDDRKFVILRHQVDPDAMRQIDALHIAGIHSSEEFRRVYPEGPVAAHLVGITNGDEHGQEGVELAFEDSLNGAAGQRRVISDNLHRIVDEDWLRPPIDGTDLQLSIDNRIQYAAFSTLEAAVQANAAQAGSIVVLDVHTGEILAIANWPSYDPNQRGRLDADRMRNRAVTDTFEPGSTMKPISIAAAMDAGVVTPTTLIPTGNGHMTISGHTISDTHALGTATVEQVIVKSSNVGAATIALKMPAQSLWDMYNGVGFGRAAHAGFPHESTGRLWPAKTWGQLQQASVAFGYGVSVSLLQLAHAYLAFARDGDVPPVTLLRVDTPPPAVRVVKSETAREMRAILERVVSSEGTANAARVPGYRAAGKTGTARKARAGGYSGTYVASFVGFAPASDPRIVVAVMIDEPAAGRIYGGDVAGPVFSQVAGAALRTLQVPSDALPAPVLARSGEEPR